MAAGGARVLVGHIATYGMIPQAPVVNGWFAMLDCNLTRSVRLAPRPGRLGRPRSRFAGWDLSKAAAPTYRGEHPRTAQMLGVPGYQQEI